MRLGIEAGIYTLDLAVQENIQGVPVFVDELIQKGTEATLAPIRERGLEVCQIGAFGFNPLSSDNEQLAKQKANLEKIIPMAVEEIGCPYVVICGGNYHPSGFLHGDVRNFSDGAIDIIASKLIPLVELAERYRVKLSIEPYIKTAINSPEKFLLLQKKIGSDALKINVDVTSFYGYWEMWDSTSMVNHICTSLKDHYGLGHIKDISLSEGFHIHMGLAPLGSSLTNWSEVIRLMEPNLPEDSWLILEHITSLAEAHESLKILRQAADDAGVTLE